MKVILATGNLKVDDSIQQHIADVEYIGQALFREALEGLVERKTPDVIILSNALEGTMSNEELIMKIRRNFPRVRVIFLLTDNDPVLKSFLYKLSIFDVFISTFKKSELHFSIHQGKRWEDIADDLVELNPFERNLPTDNFHPSTMNNLNIDSINNGYEKMHNNSMDKSRLLKKVISSWSVLDQSGKTFSAVNTALMLSTNADLKILLLDFNIDNPNIHLQFGFTDTDGDHNLGAVVDDALNGTFINNENFGEYIVGHPVYTNLDILPGYILKMKNPSSKLLTDIFDQIIDIANTRNYTTIIVDLGSGIRNAYTLHILKKSDKILVPISESPGQLYAIKKTFDKEVGPFVSNFLDRNKVIPFINQSSKDDASERFKQTLNLILDVKHVICTFNNENDIRISILDGSPLLKEKPADDIYYNFSLIANEIHENLFIVPQDPNALSTKKSKKTSGIFSNLFSRLKFKVKK